MAIADPCCPDAARVSRGALSGGRVATRAAYATGMLDSRATLAVVAVSAGLAAQSWSLVGTSPLVHFGASGDLLVRDAAGPIGFDETLALTLLPSGGGWVGQAATPPARQSATLVADNRAYLFGGLVGGALANDLWFFDRNQSTWLSMASSPSPFGPSPRAGAKAATIGGTFVVFFGGFDATGLPGDTWLMLNVSGAPLWVQRPTPASLVGRTGHAMCLAPASSVLLFGGTGAAGALGDTWVLDVLGNWTQHLGASPPAAADCRVAYDAGRDMVVMAHPSGETWEWNGFHWRRVGVASLTSWVQPALLHDPVLGSVTAWQSQAAVLEQYRFTPSLADFQLTLDLTCTAVGELELAAFQRSLPILGQSLHLRATGMSSTALFFGVAELSTLFVLPIGCSCMLGVTGVGAVAQFVPGTGGQRNWFLPIANVPALNGVAIDVQGVLLDPSAPCFAMTTQRGMLVPGW